MPAFTKVDYAANKDFDCVFHGHVLRSALWKSANQPKRRKEHRQRVSNGNSEDSAKMTFADAAATHLRNLDDNLSIKPRTRHYWRQRLAALIKSWPRLNETEVRKITQADCKKWASA